jgi:hypothetical protein
MIDIDACPTCGSTRVKNNGHTRHGKQNHLGKTCERQFSAGVNPQHWTAIRPLLSIRNEHEYDLAMERLNLRLDKVRTDERHALYSLFDTLGTLLHTYEDTTIPCQNAVG